ncbi:MAG: hypothetical protein A3J94_01020 [Syntrophus sp. RIFOXYC2_FULL_54_9]|nr:MAG: hypothetical protein A3J94_01020 [Syntrophus sp. RIFOXYC2_FULL_54_9]
MFCVKEHFHAVTVPQRVRFLISQGKFPAACGERNIAPVKIPRCLRRGASFVFKFLKTTGIGVTVVFGLADDHMIKQDQLHQFTGTQEIARCFIVSGGWFRVAGGMVVYQDNCRR